MNFRFELVSIEKFPFATVRSFIQLSCGLSARATTLMDALERDWSIDGNFFAVICVPTATVSLHKSSGS
jgi:hypothetical protein